MRIFGRGGCVIGRDIFGIEILNRSVFDSDGLGMDSGTKTLPKGYISSHGLEAGQLWAETGRPLDRQGCMALRF